jgi:hypothetical protein
MVVTKLYETPEAIIAACLSAMALAPPIFPMDLPPDPLASDVPAWHKFENSAWAIGETIRQSLKARPNLKRDPAVLHAIIEVIKNRNLRRGRESFVMLLGFTGAAKHAATVAGFAGDPDVCGHVVDTLLKMRVPGYIAQVSELTSHKRAWIRRLAKKYVERYAYAA